ncbi:protein toll-like [Mytilus californianus]|uniref:protein toll-like n=1 Tax=Mytilus californianus TaxID=6549 RepID=UPI002246334F|nr:protein toll-like [Mytilus californianus]
MNINIIWTTFILQFFILIQALTHNYVEEDMQSLFNRTDLRCPMKCNNGPSIFQMSCCICQSKSDVKNLGHLTIVNKRNHYDPKIVNNGGKHELYVLNHRYGNLEFLPGNTCNFKELFIIDLSFNKIKTFDTISCLTNLDTLLLRGNNIQYMNNNTFVNMRFLRIIDLSLNKISLMDPGFLLNMKGSLFYLNVSFNMMSTLDITNAIASKQKYFCRVDYSHNSIKSLTNDQTWKLKRNTTLGHGGMVNLSNNSLTSFFDLDTLHFLGFERLLLIGKLIYYGFDLRDNKWNCDCKIYQFAKAAEPLAQVMTRGYFDVKCYAPGTYKNKSIFTIIKDRQYDGLICNLSLADKCPPKCRCMYQPAVRNRTLIDCSELHLTKLPRMLPDYNVLEVDLSNNSLRNLPLQFRHMHKHGRNIKHYLERIRLFNFSNNQVRMLPRSNLFRLRKAEIDFRENNINSLHRSIAELNPCNIYLDTIEMQCKCNDIWLQQWLPRSDSKCHKNVQVLCRFKEQLISIKYMTRKDLGCRIPDTNFIWISSIIVAAFIIVVLLSAIIFSFRFEIFIIGRKFVKYFKGTSYPLTLFYDVYIACNEEDEKIRLWLTTHLLPSLEVNHMFRVFWPCRDSEIGVPREEEMIHVMSHTQTFIIVLSEEYKGTIRWNEKEWKHAWHNYTRDMNREIIIINYDLLEANEIAKRYLGAFLRIGQFIDFSNHKKSIEDEIASLLTKQDKNLKKYDRKNFSHSQIDDEKFPFLKQYALYSEFRCK